MNNDQHHRVIADLRRELDEAHAKINELTKILTAQKQAYPPEFHLTKAETAIVDCLRATDGTCSYTRLSFAMDQTLGTDDCRDPATIKVIISGLRKKLLGIGVQIATVWGVGYSLGIEDKKQLDEAIASRLSLLTRKELVNTGPTMRSCV